MKYLILLLAFISCNNNKPIQTERGVVIQTSYTPEQDATSTGYSTGGHVVFSTIHFDPNYSVVFRCQHNATFSINNQDLFGRLKQGDIVTITYQDAAWWESGSYEFIDAKKIEKKIYW